MNSFWGWFSESPPNGSKMSAWVQDQICKCFLLTLGAQLSIHPFFFFLAFFVSCFLRFLLSSFLSLFLSFLLAFFLACLLPFFVSFIHSSVRSLFFLSFFFPLVLSLSSWDRYDFISLLHSSCSLSSFSLPSFFISFFPFFIYYFRWVGIFLKIALFESYNCQPNTGVRTPTHSVKLSYKVN